MDESEKLARAKQQVAAITGFYIHLIVFVLVMLLLLAINWATTPTIWWVQWPFLGWGVGILAHALAVFGQLPRAVTNWQQRKVEELKNKM
jgi:uncharacterized membrane protein